MADVQNDRRHGAPMVSIIVPCYNEAAGIAQTVSALDEAFRDSESWKYEFLFVDDHSSDETPRELLRHADVNPRVKVVRLATNSGSHVGLVPGGVAAARQSS